MDDVSPDPAEFGAPSQRAQTTPGLAAAVSGGAAVVCLALALHSATGMKPRSARAYGPDTIGTTGQRMAADTVVSSLNNQLTLWKLQHNERLPDFITYPKWEQFTQFTDRAGRPSSVRNADQLFGPYVQPAPVNPLNGLASVVTVDEPVKPGDVLPFGQSAGFVFSTATGRFSITDAPGTRVINPSARARTLGPRPGGSPGDAGRRDAAEMVVETVRSQLELYRAQHAGRFPEFLTHPDWEQLTERTDENGAFDPAGKFGPYFERPPVNPGNGGTQVQVVRTPPGPGFLCTTPGVGYVFDASTGRIIALDPQGRPYPW